MNATRVIAAAAAIAIAAATAVIGADPAAAATPRNFCVDSQFICADYTGEYAQVAMEGNLNYTWLFNGLDHPGQIQLATNLALCMQLDHAAGNLVIVAPCNGASYQGWSAQVINGANIVYRSQWDPTQCLTYNRDHARLDTVTCNGAWYQNFPYTD
jgi:hypothetical protein